MDFHLQPAGSCRSLARRRRQTSCLVLLLLLPHAAIHFLWCHYLSPGSPSAWNLHPSILSDWSLFSSQQLNDAQRGRQSSLHKYWVSMTILLFVFRLRGGGIPPVHPQPVHSRRPLAERFCCAAAATDWRTSRSSRFLLLLLLEQHSHGSSVSDDCPVDRSRHTRRHNPSAVSPPPFLSQQEPIDHPHHPLARPSLLLYFFLLSGGAAPVASPPPRMAAIPSAGRRNPRVSNARECAAT